jgi:sphingolipid delta-4 desaturase
MWPTFTQAHRFASNRTKKLEYIESNISPSSFLTTNSGTSSFTMPASTSTVTTAREKDSNGNGSARLRAEKRVEAILDAPPLEVREHDFFWTYTEEPHRTRRMAIIKAHPEVTKLCGPEPLTKYVVFGVVALQVFCAYMLQNTPFLSWKFFLTSYVIGATANQNLFLAIHEISHNLAFRVAWMNRAIAIFANLPIGVPYSASFRVRYLLGIWDVTI